MPLQRTSQDINSQGFGLVVLNHSSLSTRRVLDDVTKWKYFPRYWPFVGNPPNTDGFPSQGPVAPEQTLEQTIAVPVILDAIALIMTSL